MTQIGSNINQIQLLAQEAGQYIVDCPTQLILYWYLSVFHYEYQSYKYERNTAGKSAMQYTNLHHHYQYLFQYKYMCIQNYTNMIQTNYSYRKIFEYMNIRHTLCGLDIAQISYLVTKFQYRYCNDIGLYKICEGVLYVTG